MRIQKGNGKMTIESVRDYAAMSSVGAPIIFDDVMRKISRGERYNLGLATGNTMITLYEELAEKFNRQNTAFSAGGDSSLVPRYAATIGMAPILAARKCLLLACFTEQTAPLRAIIEKGRPTPFLPASYLWRHPDFRLV